MNDKEDKPKRERSSHGTKKTNQAPRITVLKEGRRSNLVMEPMKRKTTPPAKKKSIPFPTEIIFTQPMKSKHWHTPQRKERKDDLCMDFMLVSPIRDGIDENKEPRHASGILHLEDTEDDTDYGSI